MKQKLIEQVREYATRTEIPQRGGNVYFKKDNLENPAIHALNEALYRMDTEEQIQFLLAFTKLWYTFEADLTELIGQKQCFVCMNLMYTLTAQGNQLRCWYGIPDSLCYNANGDQHIDSFGKGCLFSVHGEPAYVRKFEVLIQRPEGCLRDRYMYMFWKG